MILQEDIDFLAHFGVKGMQWGVRNSTPGVSRKVNKDARKDAEESARAKMFYGQGAGTRRKLINNSVEAKKKRVPGYAKAFDEHLARQDMSTHASKAQSERSRKDTKEKTKKRAGYIARRFTGEMGTQAAFTAAAFAGVAFARSPRGQAMMSRTISSVRNSQQSRRAASYVADFLRNQA